jgi:uncharacterized protein (DUF1810 family)
LGRSPTAKFYGLSGEEEARAYLAHPVLGPRYLECVAAVRAGLEKGRSLEAIFGELDAMKFRSSVKVFGELTIVIEGCAALPIHGQH